MRVPAGNTESQNTQMDGRISPIRTCIPFDFTVEIG